MRVMAEKRQGKHKRPTAAQMDERVSIPLDPEQAIQAVMETGPHPREADEKPKREKRS